MSGQISDLSILTELSALLERPVDNHDLARARQHLLDWIGCAAAGRDSSAGKVLMAFADCQGDHAVFAWGGLGNILEMDDVDKRALLHPGPSIVPAALILAGGQNSSFESLLEALVVGYEATIRLGRATGSGHYALWHSTGTCGAIGAAAACAKLLGLDRETTTHALALSVSQAAGVWHTRHDANSMGKQLHTAVAARAGYESAQLAALGFKGPRALLEGEQGFFQAMCPNGDPTQVVAGNDAAWMIHDVSFKPWPACRHAHAVIDAALTLRDQIDVSALRSIRVRTYADALKFCDRDRPTTSIEAKFSLQHCVAVTLLRGKPELEDFEAAAINDEDISRLRAQVQVEVGADFDDRYPRRFGAEVSVHDHKMVIADALGDPENPMSTTEVEQKAQKLMSAGGVSADTSRQIIDNVMRGAPNASALRDDIQEVLA